LARPAVLHNRVALQVQQSISTHHLYWRRHAVPYSTRDKVRLYAAGAEWIWRRPFITDRAAVCAIELAAPAE